MKDQWIWRRGEVEGGTGRRGGSEGCDQNILYERRINNKKKKGQSVENYLSTIPNMDFF